MWQQIIAGLVVAVAAGLLGRRLWRSWRGQGSGCSCGADGPDSTSACQTCAQRTGCNLVSLTEAESPTAKEAPPKTGK